MTVLILEQKSMGDVLEQFMAANIPQTWVLTKLGPVCVQGSNFALDQWIGSSDLCDSLGNSWTKVAQVFSDFIFWLLPENIYHSKYAKIQSLVHTCSSNIENTLFNLGS